jgi:hypothetical protein
MHNSKTTVSHYEYIKQISLAWINPDKYWPKEMEVTEPGKRKVPDDDENTIVTRASRKLKIDSTSSVSSDAATIIKTSTLCIPITESNLHPVNGKLKHRLNYSVQHYPQYSKVKAPRCQLHRWARGRDKPAVKKAVVTCSVCRVHLSIPCFNIFHKEANITDIKSDIAAS